MMISPKFFTGCPGWRRWLFLILCGGILLTPGLMRAAGKSAEEQDMTRAVVLFKEHQYSLAETNFGNFLTTYTNSTHRADATLYLARARLEQSNYDGAIQLLTNGVAQSGHLAAEYVFWIASARLDKGDFNQAAAGFANLIKNYPDTPWRLDAAFDEAQAWAGVRDWPRVVELLQKPYGSFRTLAAADPKNPIVTRGVLLLGEALLAQKRFADGEKAVNAIDASALDPEWQWRRQYLLCRLELADGRPADALAGTTNLLDNATGPRHLAASRFLRGEIFESLGRPRDALQSYTNNLAAEVPADDQRQALLKTVTLTLSQNQAQDAVQLLEDYLAQRTNGPALDLARLSLGELYLKIHYTPSLVVNTNDLAVPTTNYLQQAQGAFDTVISNFPSSPLLAQAHLDRGWCYWAQTNMAAAESDFQYATDQLRPSPEQAVARFKLADTELYQHKYAPALTNYSQLLSQYASVESVTNGGLFDQALYQIIEASLALGREQDAENALREILQRYPNSLFSDRGQLLIGESKTNDYEMARREFSEVLKRSPNTPMLAEAQFAIARTYEQEGDWTNALRKYEVWLELHTTNSPLRSQVEYARALDYDKAGMESNALALFTNYVARYPATNLAAWAQNWIADYYYNHGDIQSAEENYQLLYQKFPNAGDLAYQARLMAGRCALARNDTDEARQYFSDLVNNTNAPASFVAQGYFALGSDVFLHQYIATSNNVALDQAIKALSNLTNGAPTNAMAALAFGRLGDCYRQWANVQWQSGRHDPAVFADAIQMYQSVLAFPATNIDVGTRSEAEVALGQIAEQQSQSDRALDHYRKVLYDLEPFDPFWVEQAGKAAGGIYERQQQWDKAIMVYRRVLKAVPSLKPALEKLINAAQIAADKAQN
jgi:TolA-binding protein